MRVDTKARPACPVCGTSLKREISTFAHIIRGSVAPAEDGMPQDADDSAAQRMDAIMTKMGDRIQALDDDDAAPCEAVKLMREMAEAGGLHFDKDVKEAMARIEAGEDPEKIDADFSEVFDRENPFSDSPEGARAETSLTARTLRYLRAPRRDPTWHDL